MAFGNLAKNILIFGLIVSVIFAGYFVYSKGIFNKIISKNKEIEDQKIEQPKEVADKVKTSVSDLDFLIEYCRTHNIAIPSDIMSLIRDGDKFVASAKLKDFMYDQVVGWKDLLVIQAVYQEDTEAATTATKQKFYSNLDKIVGNIKSGSTIDAQLNLLKATIDPSLLSIQTVKKYDCTKMDFDEYKDLKAGVNELNENEFTQIYDRNGYSYILVYASKVNKSSYCSLDEFIKAYKR